MVLRNWIELGVVLVLYVNMAIWKYVTHKRVSRLNGLGNINKDGPGSGEILGD